MVVIAIKKILFINDFELPVLCPSHMETSVQKCIMHGAGELHPVLVHNF